MEEEVKKQVKIESIVVDTINAIQNNQYMSMLDRKTMVSREKWKDFGVDIYAFMVEGLQDLGFEVVLILGYEGTGKSFGIKYLKPRTNIWYNPDRKNPTFKNVEHDGKEVSSKLVYGTKTNPTKYMVIPKTYKDIVDHVQSIKQAGLLSEKPVAFLIGHIEDYKIEEGETRKRLKTLGSLATKMNIEGSVENCFYSVVDVVGDDISYVFDTKNSGSNSARSSELLFQTRFIDNNFDTILKAIQNYN